MKWPLDRPLVIPTNVDVSAEQHYRVRMKSEKGEVEKMDAHNSFILMTAEAGFQGLLAFVVVLTERNRLRRYRCKKDQNYRSPPCSLRELRDILGSPHAAAEACNR